MDEIYYWSATQLIEAMRKKELSAVEVMKTHLDRIEKINPRLNALVQRFSREECLKKALEADQEMARGRTKGKLHGLPITIKDMHLVKGLISCIGCMGLKDRVATEDSTIVSRLIQEGAIVMGITNVPEFLSAYETDNLVYGRTNNPYDLSKTPGGSSGGCAALVAAGCIPLSLGSDAGGSIRWPAHCTGVAGHKPTIGLVPRTGSVFGNARGLMGQFGTSGPLARSVQDLILTLPILAGPDGLDPHIPPVSLKDVKSVDIRSLRVAYLTEVGSSKPSIDIVNTIEMVVRELKPHVATIELINIPCLKETYRLLWELFYLGADQGQGTKNILAMFGVDKPSPLLQEFLKQAEKSNLTVTQFRNLFREIDLYRIEMLQALKDYDILLSPVANTTAKSHGKTHEESRDMTPCMMHSLTGWPVTVVRCGVSSSGLPIGLQVAAKSWNDHISLALGAKMESLFGGWQPPISSLD